METYELLQILIKRYPNNYELGAAMRNLYHEIKDRAHEHGNDTAPNKHLRLDYMIRDVINKNFQPS